MKRVIYIGLFLLFSLAVLINSVEISYSINTYEIKTEGEYYLSGGTNVRISGSFCKNFKNMDNGTTTIFKDNSEFIKIPNDASNYLLIVKNTGNTKGNLREANCSFYEYNAPVFSATCTANAIGSDEFAFCDLYLTTSNYGNELITLNKYGDNLSITDFQSNYFNYVESNNNFIFMPKQDLRMNYKYLVGTLKVTNISKPDGVKNDLIFDDIVIKDSISSFKVDGIKFTFNEVKIDSYGESEKTTTTSVQPSPKTDIEYNSKNKNASNKNQVRTIILLFLFVIITSISLGFIIVFFFKDKKSW